MYNKINNLWQIDLLSSYLYISERDERERARENGTDCVSEAAVSMCLYVRVVLLFLHMNWFVNPCHRLRSPLSEAVHCNRSRGESCCNSAQMSAPNLPVRSTKKHIQSAVRSQTKGLHSRPSPPNNTRTTVCVFFPLTSIKARQ